MATRKMIKHGRAAAAAKERMEETNYDLIDKVVPTIIPLGLEVPYEYTKLKEMLPIWARDSKLVIWIINPYYGTRIEIGVLYGHLNEEEESLLTEDNFRKTWEQVLSLRSIQ